MQLILEITSPRPEIELKKTSSEPPGHTEIEILTLKETRTGKKKTLICKFCGHEITSRAESLEMGGNHTHSFMNPAGIRFRIGCFTRAKGCVVAGEATDEHTWFPGYSWQFALCGLCAAHMGWFYGSAGHGFFGLILENLVEL
ncbi:MAG: hypothetical protein EPN93_17780 [Spirochaetes bacterium]|nr:MAG: hypothetical protein EPN93_17780 [Spirochaetota bacterium]